MDPADSVTDLTRGVYRRLYSGFTKGQRINKLSLQAEAWFWRVLATVDDFGNGDADPDLCHAATAGRRKVTPNQIQGWLKEMTSVGLIRLYSIGNENYLHVVNFEETQPGGKNGKRIRRIPVPDESRLIQVNPKLSSASEDEREIENDHEKENEKVAHAAKPRSPSTPTLCDEEFLVELQSDEAYTNLNVRQVNAKMARWCKQNGKVATRRRLINWLNREDEPMENGNGTNKTRYESTPERNARNLRENVEYIRKLSNSGGEADREDPTGLLSSGL